uniref:helix-turn-helix domain-containing protein n=1 Tax=Vaginimicrobium propionicum TaxID=1871034 RepID=UPI000970C8F6|nr:UDP-N-acetylglucosamine 1-carboxyvinyltransferase [Vaginimicrobium propionicum]
MTNISPEKIGRLIRDARLHRGMTQSDLAKALKSSQSAVHRIETGHQNVTLEMVNRIAEALSSTLITTQATPNFRITGCRPLSGSIAVRSSKNAAVSLLCASLLNAGRTVLRGIARIEEVSRLIEVLNSIGVKTEWSVDGKDLTVRRPETLDISSLNRTAGEKTRSIIMFLGPLMHLMDDFTLPYAGGCDLGTRTVEPHLQALRHFGLNVVATEGNYRAHVNRQPALDRHIVLTERGDTVTENALLAAAMAKGTTVIRNASPNYMVQDLCVFLTALGVKIDGIGTTTLKIVGTQEISKDIEYIISEDPIEAMSLITAGIVTGCEITVQRAPIEFLEIELSVLAEMGQQYSISPEYLSGNGFTRLVDITVHPSELHAAVDKIHPMPFPGLNIDNLPFFAVIAACAHGTTLIHDWVYETRASHLLDLNKLGARTKLFDLHRLEITGPTKWRARDMVSPPALRPAMCVMLAMLAARGTSVLRDVYVINRGYEELPHRLSALGAEVEEFTEADDLDS